MKKTIVILIILAILGGVVFGFGYVPLRVEPGTEVLIFSKTSGWDSAPLPAGTFAWRWQLLIPRNVSIYSFSSEPRRVSVSTRTALPSADLYREYLEGTPLLEERINLRLRYRISDEGLRSIAPSGLGEEGLTPWYEDFDDQLTRTTTETVSETLQSLLSDGDPGSLSQELLEAIEREIAEKHPDVVLESVILEDIAVPDLVLYQLGRETYLEIQEVRRRTLEEATVQSTAARAQQSERLETLARYGEILDKHPVLLEYLEIAARHGDDPLDLGRLEILTD
jgi:regulator of protease activity HflC (stomatin/prohibitin superfamily)